MAESWRNLTAVGALPLALTDNMNFGNPEKPEIMGEFVGAIEGMREACLALDYPVVSGNVSLYNETSGSAILPTPVIGGVGLIADVRRAVDLALKRDGDALILIGETKGHLGASLVPARDRGARSGAAAAGRSRRRAQERRFRARADRRRATSPPVTTSPMAASSSRWPRWRWPAASGVALDALPAELPPHAWLFGEDQARYLFETADPDRLLSAAASAGVPAQRIGVVVGQGAGAALTLPGAGAISVAELKAANEAWLPAYMAQS